MNISHQHKNNKPIRGPDENLVPRLTCSLVIKIYLFLKKSKENDRKFQEIYICLSKLLCLDGNLLEKSAFYGILYSRYIFDCFQKNHVKGSVSL